MRRRGAPVSRQGMLPSFDEISDADMLRAAGRQRAQENRKKALAKLAARRVVRTPTAYTPAAPRMDVRAARLQKRDEDVMRWAAKFDDQFGSDAPEWVVRRLAVWDDRQNRTKLLKRSGRYALAKWWWDNGIDPDALLGWASENPSLTDKHVSHFDETFKQLADRPDSKGGGVYRSTYHAPSRAGMWREPTFAEREEWYDEQYGKNR
jgi:hypothetical protein